MPGNWRSFPRSLVLLAVAFIIGDVAVASLINPNAQGSRWGGIIILVLGVGLFLLLSRRSFVGRLMAKAMSGRMQTREDRLMAVGYLVISAMLLASVYFLLS